MSAEDDLHTAICEAVSLLNVTPTKDPNIINVSSILRLALLNYADTTVMAARKTLTKEELRGAIARGWCHPANSKKEMDVDLALAIAEEVARCIEVGVMI